MAKYLNRLDSRLSQPKLQSPIRRASQNGSQTSLRQSIDAGSTKSPTKAAEGARLRTNAQNRNSKILLNDSQERIGSGIDLAYDSPS